MSRLAVGNPGLFGSVSSKTILYRVGNPIVTPQVGGVTDET